MVYKQIRRAVFIDRPNRFIARVELGGIRICHVKNTGRCRELLVPGATVFVQERNAPGRKTDCDLIAVAKGEHLVNIDAQAPNAVFSEWVPKSGLFDGLTSVKPEQRYGRSRFDFYMEAEGRRIFVEVKGVTLEQDGIARFPDAPTERGVKHLRELIACRKDGFEAWVVFVIQMRAVRRFEPNWETHQAFGEALIAAREAGVQILALSCDVAERSITARDFVPVRIEMPQPPR